VFVVWYYWECQKKQHKKGAEKMSKVVDWDGRVVFVVWYYWECQMTCCNY
jgi:hypothetical protein